MTLKSYLGALTFGALLTGYVACKDEPRGLDPDLMFDINGDGKKDAVTLYLDAADFKIHAYVLDGKNVIMSNGRPSSWGIGTMVQDQELDIQQGQGRNLRFEFGNFDGKPGVDLKVIEHFYGQRPKGLENADSTEHLITNLNSALR